MIYYCIEHLSKMHKVRHSFVQEPEVKGSYVNRKEPLSRRVVRMMGVEPIR